VISLIAGVVTWLTFDEQLNAALEPDAPLFTTADLVSYAVSFLVAALSILFALLDYRALVRARVPKPFHWAWIFFALVNVPVYIIGRSIVVRRRTGSGLAPMVVYLALWIANFVLGIVFAALTIGPLLDELSQTGY
jgi:ABC-type spermidine/putrescine transport system permease subunit II